MKYVIVYFQIALIREQEKSVFNLIHMINAASTRWMIATRFSIIDDNKDGMWVRPVISSSKSQHVKFLRVSLNTVSLSWLGQFKINSTFKIVFFSSQPTYFWSRLIHVILYWWAQAEVKFLGKFSHPNLVKLLGYCWEERQFLLVYEYMQRGSLESHLFRSNYLLLLLLLLFNFHFLFMILIN